MKKLKYYSIKLFLFLLIFLILYSQSFSSNISVSTENALNLSFAPDGDINGLQVKGNNLLINGKTGGFYVRDMGLIPVKDFKNGSFESEEGWNFGYNWLRDRREFHSGKWSAKLEVPDSTEDNSRNLTSGKISVEPEQEHLLTLWLKIKKLKGDSFR